MKSNNLLPNKIDRTRLPFIGFLLSAAVLLFLIAFAWGFMSAKNKSFPHDNIRDMAESIQTLKELYKIEVATDRSAHEIIGPVTRGGVTVNKPASDDRDYIFMTLYKSGQFTAQVVDRRGQIIHSWRIPYKEQKLYTARDTRVALSRKNLTIHGASLAQNGDLYLVIEYRGLLKLSKESDLLWAIHLPVHHVVTADSDGPIWTLSRRKVRNRKEWIPLATRPYWDDQIIHLSSEGEILEQFSVLDIVLQNQYEGILYGGHPGKPTIAHDDPLHVNDMDVLTKEQAVHFPGVKEGDIMVSLLTISTVLVFDRRTHAIKWSMTGPFHRQHDPQISHDGTLLVFDNRTARGQRGQGAKYLVEPQDLGYSRLLAIDPVSRKIVWQFQGTRKRPFYTSIQGKLEILQNGNILAVESEGGRVFEIEKGTKTIVWEYINLIEEGVVGRITQAIPLSEDQVGFLTGDE